jgi:molybdenum cofactor cytidylyltransferase
MDRDAVELRNVGLVILAAGASRRLGRPKQLLTYRGRSLLRHTAETVVHAGCRPIIVVLGAYAQACEGELRGLPVRMVRNLRWCDGMGASLRAGVQALTATGALVEAVVITLCDQPLLSAHTITSLVEVHRASGSPIVASEYGGAAGVPALFHHTLFGALLSLEGSEGARSVIVRYGDLVRRVPFAGGAVDIDTLEDYAQLGARAEAEGANSRIAHMEEGGPPWWS